VTTRWITVPLLSPTLSFLLLMTLLLAAQWSFPLVGTLTDGGPSNATTNIYYLLWAYAFGSFDAGLGACCCCTWCCSARSWTVSSAPD
jgi:multiple sugar transport system permease protein